MHEQRQLDLKAPGTDAKRDVLMAVAEGRAAWRLAFGAKGLSNDLHLSLGGTYRKLDTAEAFIRWLMVTRPAEATAWLSRLAAEAATLIGLPALPSSS